MKKTFSKVTDAAVKNWWVSILIGILSLAFGVLFIAQPLEALVALAILFVLNFFIVGVSEIIFAVSNRKLITGWGWYLTGGIIDILLGALLLSIPVATPMIMIYFVGFWILLQSVWAIGISINLQIRGVIRWGWLLMLAVLGIIFSFIFIMSPVFASQWIVLMAAISFFAYGIFRIYLGVELQSWKNKLRK